MDILSPVAEARNSYSYSADGVKLRVVQRYNSNFNTAPVIGSAINLSNLNKVKTTDYVGNKVFENNALKRILVDGGYIEGGNYYFYLADHLGNNRVVVRQDGVNVQNTDYYPYGESMAHSSGDAAQPYKFGGKEYDAMHGLNLYDFSARMEDPSVGRFTTVDPLAEKKPWLSPYNMHRTIL
ncbi:MAG: RHS repeat-associated core domain-containing protein [Dysgonamonadaceae bacterium]